jgi:hypothetical protein
VVNRHAAKLRMNLKEKIMRNACACADVSQFELFARCVDRINIKIQVWRFNFSLDYKGIGVRRF